MLDVTFQLSLIRSINNIKFNKQYSKCFSYSVFTCCLNLSVNSTQNEFTCKFLSCFLLLRKETARSFQCVQSLYSLVSLNFTNLHSNSIDQTKRLFVALYVTFEINHIKKYFSKHFRLQLRRR